MATVYMLNYVDPSDHDSGTVAVFTDEGFTKENLRACLIDLHQEESGDLPEDFDLDGLFENFEEINHDWRIVSMGTWHD